MRIWHRLKTLVPLLLAVAVGAECQAQSMGGYPSYGAPAFMAGGGDPYQGVPQSFQSHPMISPYDHALEQHFSSDGIWFKRMLSGMGQMNDYYLNVDYIHTRSRTMGGTVGDGRVPTFDQLDLRTTPGNFPDALFFPTFPNHNSDSTGPNKNSGIRLSGGVDNRLGWGFSWNATYNGESTDVFDTRKNLEANRLHFIDALTLEATGGVSDATLPSNLRHLDQRKLIEEQILNNRVFDAADAEVFGVFGSTFEVLDRYLYPLGGIGIQNGNGIGGVSQLFDLDYRIEHEIKSYGGGFHFSSSPIYETDSFRVRPIVGGRVFRIMEAFKFFGADSGLAYTFSQPNNQDDDGDAIIDNVEENGALDFTDPITTDTEEIMVRSFVNNYIRSTLTGPEIGLEYELGEKGGVAFSGSTRVGALFNVEKANLEGDNIGDTFAVTVDPITGLTTRSEMFDTSTDNGQLTLNAFRDSNETTHLSPMFEQSLNAELPIFSHIPVLRDVWQLEHARLRLGWTYTWIGEVANPTTSIRWESNPRAGVFPSLKTSRGEFFQNTFNAGLNWEF